MIASNSLARIVAFSIVLASTLGSAAPAPGPDKAVDNTNTPRSISTMANGIVERAEEDKNSEEFKVKCKADVNVCGVVKCKVDVEVCTDK
jgi:hypothetical protein